jgi:hypothetical protein
LELPQRALDFGLELVAGNVGEAGGKIGKQPLKREKLFERCRRGTAGGRRPFDVNLIGHRHHLSDHSPSLHCDCR